MRKTLRPGQPGLKSNLMNLIRFINCISMANSPPAKADLGGLKIAFQALMKSLKTKPQPEKTEGLTQEQRFC